MGITLLPSEAILKNGSANYQKGWEAIVGSLTLTSLRLCFESRKLNFTTGGVSIDLREIAAVHLAWSKLVVPVFPNVIILKMHDGGVHQFVVFGRSKWAAAIKEQIAAVSR